MRLIHFAKEPVAEIYPVVQAQKAMKPKGLWVSDEDCEDSWSAWCRNEDFNLESLAVAHEVTLAPDANLLRIDSAEGIDRFTITYAALDGYYPRWDILAKRYQGILITPYVWSRRLSRTAEWYYPWDCASGCIWDSEAIASFGGVELVQP